MIDAREVINEIPTLHKFRSIAELYELAKELERDPRFGVEVAGFSSQGAPIHHISFGNGGVKALVVGGPHSHEPVGNDTVFSLLTLLKHNCRSLIDADVEWHFIPCVDPDGAILNEGWTQEPFSLRNYMRNFYLHFPPDRVDGAFPITYKKLNFDTSTPEALTLAKILDRTRPDYYFWLHNSYMGGVINLLTRAIPLKFYRELRELLDETGLPVQQNPPHERWCPKLDDGIFQIPQEFTKHYYDHLEQSGLSPEVILAGNGGTSVDYLASINPDALTFACEVPYLRHKRDGSPRGTGENLRRLKLRIDADNKYLATVIFEELEKIRPDVSPDSPFYRGVIDDIAGFRKRLSESAPFGEALQDILFNPEYSKEMTEGERLNVYVFERFNFLRRNFESVRLLADSTQTDQVRQSGARLEKVFQEALVEFCREVHEDEFETIDIKTLVKAQLGSGLIVLNSLLDH